MAKAPEIRWRDGVQDEDIVAAEEYLALRLTPARARALVPKIKGAPLEVRRVNDVLRACDRDALTLADPGVRAKLHRAVQGKKLTPAIVVSFDGVGADVAQGFHELCAAYSLDSFMQVCVLIAYED